MGFSVRIDNMAAMFQSARLKLRRADQHIEELSMAIAEYMKNGAGARTVKRYENGKFRMVVASNPVPDLVPLALGDVLHNLRSALDHTAWELVAAAGGTPSRRTYFPIADTREKLAETVNKGELKIAGQAVGSLLLNTIKSYKGGNAVLWALHSADNVDKHRLVLPVGATNTIFNLNVRHFGQEPSVSGLTMIIPAGAGIVSSPAPFEATHQGQPAVSVVFPEDSDFGNEPVIPTLRKVSAVVSGVVDAIEATFMKKA